MTTAAVALAEARRDVHELLVLLPAPNADKVREKIAVLEAVVAATTREQVARDIEQLLIPTTNDAAKLRNGGIEHAASVARNGATQ